MTWEKIGTFNFGADFRLLSSRIDGSLDYYRKKGLNLIGNIITDPTVGVKSYTGNYANMEGSGIDFILNTINLKSGFEWTSNFILSYNTDKVTHYDQNTVPAGSMVTTPLSPVLGKPISKIYAFPYGGLDPTNGDPIAYVNGEKKDYESFIQNFEKEDLIFIGSTTPRIFGSLINTFSYKNITLSFNITYKLKYYFTRTSIDYNALYSNFAGHGDYALRWQKPGDEKTTNVPSLPAAPDPARDNFYKFSDALVEKGDHIRLQDIKLSYELGKNIDNILPLLGNTTIHVYANNLGIIWRANKHNLDPDIGPNSIPAPKSVALALTVNF